MVRNNAASYKMPANAKYLSFTRSDGNADLWPKNTTPGTVDADGAVNWMRPVPLDDPSSQRWRNQIGTAVARSMGKPGDCNEWVMQDWPAGYALFDHNKAKGKGSSEIRHDLYLIGSTKAHRFRSIPELIPHAVWLMHDASEPCTCKYCTNTKSQKSITQGLSEKNILPPSLYSSIGRSLNSPSPSRTKRTARSQITPGDGTKKPRTEHRVYAAVRKPKKDVIPYITETRFSVAEPREKISDLRAILIRDGAETKRWFREKELVWCKLSRAIKGPGGKGLDDIYFWPAVIEEVVIENKTTEVAPPPTSLLPQDMATAAGGESAIIENNPEPTWKVHQSYRYRVSLLAVNYKHTYSGMDLIPYKAYELSPELSAALWQYPSVEDFDYDVDSGINPDPDENEPLLSFKDVAVRYSKAVVFAAELGSLWCLTDEWEFKYQTVLSSPPSQPNPSASTSSSHLPGSSAPNNIPFRPSLLGKQKSSQTGDEIKLGEVQVDDKYQGLWWGPERIWTGDLVRLKIDRAAMSPFAIVEDYLAPPAGPSPRVLEEFKLSDTPEGRAKVIPLLGAKSRGVYLKIEDIDLAPSDNPERPNSKHCRVAGQLYELVDHDWEEHTDTSLAKTQAPPKTPPRSGGGGDPLTQPSPMMISPLRNPDPTIPVSSATSGVLAPQQPNGSSSASASPPKHQPTGGRLSNGKLSTPHTAAPVYDLPEPPHNYKFRIITKPGYQVVFSVTLLAGRYYPRLDKHKVVEMLTNQAEKAADSEESNGVKRANFMYSLSGLVAGYYNSISPHRHTDSRVGMLQKADHMAASQMSALRNYRAEVTMAQENRQESEDQLMEVDPAEPHRS